MFTASPSSLPQQPVPGETPGICPAELCPVTPAGTSAVSFKHRAGHVQIMRAAIMAPSALFTISSSAFPEQMEE